MLQLEAAALSFHVPESGSAGAAASARWVRKSRMAKSRNRLAFSMIGKLLRFVVGVAFTYRTVAVEIGLSSNHRLSPATRVPTLFGRS